jgi:hypothetical protein
MSPDIITVCRRLLLIYKHGNPDEVVQLLIEGKTEQPDTADAQTTRAADPDRWTK